MNRDYKHSFFSQNIDSELKMTYDMLVLRKFDFLDKHTYRQIETMNLLFNKIDVLASFGGVSNSNIKYVVKYGGSATLQNQSVIIADLWFFQKIEATSNFKTNSDVLPNTTLINTCESDFENKSIVITNCSKIANSIINETSISEAKAILTKLTNVYCNLQTNSEISPEYICFNWKKEFCKLKHIVFENVSKIEMVVVIDINNCENRSENITVQFDLSNCSEVV